MLSLPGHSAFALLDHLWAALPEERETLRVYVDRAKIYRNACGCTLGGMSFLVALVALILYGFTYRHFSAEHWLSNTSLSLAVLLAATILGKLTGMGFARLQLRLLEQELRSRYPLRGESHVNMQ
jgi:hypothetical protein